VSPGELRVVGAGLQRTALPVPDQPFQRIDSREEWAQRERSGSATARWGGAG
jgi:hypothetical protein